MESHSDFCLDRLAEHEQDSVVFRFVAMEAILLWEGEIDDIPRLAQIFLIWVKGLVRQMELRHIYPFWIVFFFFVFYLHGLINDWGTGALYLLSPFSVFQNQRMSARLVIDGFDDRAVFRVKV